MFKVFFGSMSRPKSARSNRNADEKDEVVMNEESGQIVQVPKIKPQNKLNIIFDLNGTLLSYHFKNSLMFESRLAQKTEDRMKQVRHEIVEDKDPGEWGKMMTVRFRPHLDELCEFLFSPEMKDKVRVAAWTFSGRGDASRELTELAFGKYTDQLEFIWSGSKGKHGFKDLGLVWDQFPDWNAENTILVDDSPSKIVHPENAFVIPTYRFDMAIQAASFQLDAGEEVQVDKELLNLVEFVKSHIIATTTE
jgi:hypothetical protein